MSRDYAHALDGQPSGQCVPVAVMPRWLERDLRSDHAGEAGAVLIYQGILAVSRDPAVRAFASRHQATERQHLAVIESWLPASRRSRLLPVWRAAGWMTGALPAAFGPRAVFATIDAVETFVDRHYSQQVDALEGSGEWRELRAALVACRADELAHRDEARSAGSGDKGFVAASWEVLVSAVSAAAVAVARRF